MRILFPSKETMPPIGNHGKKLSFSVSMSTHISKVDAFFLSFSIFFVIFIIFVDVVYIIYIGRRHPNAMHSDKGTHFILFINAQFFV